MIGRSAHEREIREIAIAANSGEATDAQIARLDELIRSDALLANYAARVFDQQAALAWQGMTHESDRAAAASLADAEADVSDRSSSRVSAASRGAKPSSNLHFQSLAIGIAFVLGALAMTLFGHVLSNKLLPGSLNATEALSQPAYQARLVGSTACSWDDRSGGSREIGSSLTIGESLHLLQGLAEFKFNWSVGDNADLSLEGPAAMMLTSDGMPTLRFGRLTATINAAHRPFVLDTPVGRLIVAEYGSIGISAFGNDAEIHVFDGSATLESTWLSPGQQVVPMSIEAGQAIRVQENAGGELGITRHSADERYFAAHVSMESDTLVVPASYVSAIKAARPLVYWRFERDDWPNVPNAMGGHFAGHVEGSLGTTAHQGNQAVEFGVTNQGGAIVSDDVLDKPLDSYSIEFWIKPSHYHVGAVVSLVGDEETPVGTNPHGLLCELGGTGQIPTAVHHPGRVRFLHRDPPSNDSTLGTSCYSTAAYTLRKWQHMVLVKDGGQMRIYFNGELAGSAEDDTQMASDLRLLLGRLYPSRRVRPFIGQLDELALYDRALTPTEIKQHFHVVRPAPPNEPSS